MEKKYEKEEDEWNEPSIELRIDPRLESLAPRMTDTEFRALVESIQAEGQRVPIVIDQNHFVVDGHHRLRACKELGIQPKTQTLRFRHFEHRMEYVFQLNVLRRQLNTFQRIELFVLHYEPMEKEKARERQISGPLKVKEPPSSVQNYTDDQKGKVIEICAKKIGTSAMTYSKGRYLVLNAPDEVKEQLRRGNQSINRAHKLMVSRRKQPESGKLSLVRPKDSPAQGKLATKGKSQKSNQSYSLDEEEMSDLTYTARPNSVVPDLHVSEKGGLHLEFTCGNCGKTFQSTPEYDLHFQKYHPDEDPIITQTSDEKVFRLLLAVERWRTLEALKASDKPFITTPTTNVRERISTKNKGYDHEIAAAERQKTESHDGSQPTSSGDATLPPHGSLEDLINENVILRRMISEKVLVLQDMSSTIENLHSINRSGKEKIRLRGGDAAV